MYFINELSYFVFTMLQAESILKSYGTVQVLKGLNLSVEKGEIVALFGSSGAGKSTFLQILGTLDAPDSGRVIFNGDVVSEFSEKRKAAFRGEQLGFIFQFHHLMPEFSALENVCIPAWMRGKSTHEVRKRATELLERLNLGHRLSHMPSQMSGGEQQRVAIARALINNPALILADEPTGNLDSANAQEIFHLMKELSVDLGLTFIIATHQEQFASSADRSVRMQDGIIHQIIQHV
jgi:lipoprotein-releasing system ATP-binding protein